MVIIFGWGRGEAQDRGEVVPTVCPNCHNQVYLHEIQSNKQVSLYFVPLASYGSDVYLACPICRHGVEIGPGHRSAADAMVYATRMVRTGQLAPQAYQAQVDRFLTQMGLNAQPAALAAAAQAPTPDETLTDRIANLANLRAQGVLTEEEFTAAKRRLLDLDPG
jgi:hypothetical protein